MICNYWTFCSLFPQTRSRQRARILKDGKRVDASVSQQQQQLHCRSHATRDSSVRGQLRDIYTGIHMFDIPVCSFVCPYTCKGYVEHVCGSRVNHARGHAYSKRKENK